MTVQSHPPASPLQVPTYGYPAKATEVATTINSTSFQKVNQPGAQVTLVTHGGPVLVLVTARCNTGVGGASAVISLGVDGVADPEATDGNIYTGNVTNFNDITLPIQHVFPALAAGSHTFELYARLISGTAINITCNQRERMFAYELR